MVHHIPDQRARAGRESVQHSVAREILIWLIADHPDNHGFPNQLAPADMALNEAGDVYMYTGLRLQLLVSSAPAEGSGDLEVKGLTTPSPGGTLKVTHETP